jgi:hypothetical protein
MNLHKDENRQEILPSLVDADKQRRSLKEKWPRYSRLDVVPQTAVAMGPALGAVESGLDACPSPDAD